LRPGWGRKVGKVFERFTDRARRVVVLAQEEARLLKHNYIGTEHLLLGLVREGDGIAAEVLRGLNVDLERMRESLRNRIGEGGAPPLGHIPFTPRAKTVLELSLREALQLGHNYIGTEHVLLGLVREGQGVGAQTLAEFGVEVGAVRQAVIQRLGSLPKEEVASEARGEARAAPPNCPGCWRSLEGGTVSKVITVAGEGAPSEERRVRLLYCSTCGRTLGVLPE
jgi:ATP-dependent Clp protease ATP-binding subunit ClpC